jgi:hypothetical protein
VADWSNKSLSHQVQIQLFGQGVMQKVVIPLFSFTDSQVFVLGLIYEVFV